MMNPALEGGDADENEESESSAYNPCAICVNDTSAFMQYADMREDRAVFYVNVSSNVQEVTYRIKATNVGTFVLPPAYGEAMYDRNVIARSITGSMIVSRPK